MYVSVILISDGIFMIKVGRRVLIIALLLNIDFIFFKFQIKTIYLHEILEHGKEWVKLVTPWSLESNMNEENQTHRVCIVNCVLCPVLEFC